MSFDETKIGNQFRIMNTKNRLSKAIIISLCSCFLPLLSGCNSRFHNPADVEYDLSQTPYHVVVRGDTLSGIAKQYGMDKRELARLNGLHPPYRIVIGQRLVVRSLGNSRKKAEDGFDAPASEPTVNSAGEVQVAKIAPLASVQETPNTLGMQPFGAPVGPDGQMGQPSITTEEAPANETAAQEAKALPSAPKTTPFYQWPVKGRVLKEFDGSKKGGTGIKIAAPKGTPVLASNNGVVATTRQLGAYGKLVLVRHDNGYVTIYAHLDDVNVKRGDVVAAGQKIGTVGKTGNVKEPQLHFEVRKNNKTPVDPRSFLD